MSTKSFFNANKSTSNADSRGGSIKPDALKKDQFFKPSARLDQKGGKPSSSSSYGNEVSFFSTNLSKPAASDDPLEGIQLKKIKRTDKPSAPVAALDMKALFDKPFFKSSSSTQPEVSNLTNYTSTSRSERRLKKELIVGYQKEIVTHLFELEDRYVVPAPKNLSQEHRSMFLDTYRRVFLEFKLRKETELGTFFIFFKAAAHFNSDRLYEFFLPALMIAAKVEEYYPPTIESLIKYTRADTLLANSQRYLAKLDRKHIVGFEGELYNFLKGYTTTPHIFTFLNLLNNDLDIFRYPDLLKMPYLFANTMNLITIPGILKYKLHLISLAGLYITSNEDGENIKAQNYLNLKRGILKTISDYLEDEFQTPLDFEDLKRILTEYHKNIEPASSKPFHKFFKFQPAEFKSQRSAHSDNDDDQDEREVKNKPINFFESHPTAASSSQLAHRD